jgi:periplasmic protein TonB
MLSSRHATAAAGVAALHVAAVCALLSGQVQKPSEIVIPVLTVADVSERQVQPAPQAQPAPRPRPEPRPAPRPEVRPDTLLTAQAPAGDAPVMASAPPAPAPVAPPAPAAVQAPAAPPPPPRIERPSSDAGYLQNPPPRYPPLSKRMGEQGRVLVRVLIGADGLPQRAELKASSGYERLDNAAIEYLMRCRFTPGQVGGVPQAMWHDAPVNYVLE